MRGLSAGATLYSMVLVVYGGRFGRAALSALADERIIETDLALLAPDGFFRGTIQ